MNEVKKWTEERPSNIALIKYMGKKDKALNIPSNRSFSWTLDHLKSTVQLELYDGSEDRWEPLESDFPFELSQVGKDKFLNHLKRIKEHFKISEKFIVRSCNNFPSDCGIASSASSFAALTAASFKACGDLASQKIDHVEMAKMSARGSGSSCRSFWPGFVLWDEDTVGPVASDLGKLKHMVVIVGGEAKKVSSSEAHKKVESSLLFNGRTQRTETRLQLVLDNLNPQSWEKLYQVIWAEFWDMHVLFETSTPHFSYFTPETFRVLSLLRKFWETHADGPIVTMDAGPNVHLLWRADQEELGEEFYQSHLKGEWTVLSDFARIGFDRV